jgi:pimeloyl-ACP methyl ester carboxylesterase
MAEFVTSQDGLRIAWESAGAGTPIVLVHGFASDRVQNWKSPGWYATLVDAGYRIVALDCRGHGESDKPHDATRYGHEHVADDVVAVMRAADVECAPVMGYSMGGMLTMNLLMRHPQHVERAIIGGVGGSYLESRENSRDRMADPAVRERIAAALVEPDITKVTDPRALGFRKFAEQAGKDREALAACMRANRRHFTRDELSRASQPVLVVCGENDDLTGGADDLASAFANGKGKTVPHRDHMTTVGDKVYKNEVLRFLNR